MSYNVGSILKERREELNVSQTSICRGICSNATLSRIESGECIPNEQIMSQLLERLGYSKIQIDEICSESDYETAKIITEVKRLYSNGKLEESLSLLDQFSGDYESFSPPNRRFCDTLNTMLLLKKKIITPAQALMNFEKILRETFPRYSIECLPKVMTYEEIVLLNCIANRYYNLGNTDTAIKILYHIKEFHDRFVDDESESMRFLPPVLYNLSKYLGLAGEYDECIEICEYSINKQISWERCRDLPQTLYNLGWALVKRGRENDLEYAKEVLINAYYLGKTVGKSKFVDLIRKFISEVFPDQILY